MSNLESKESGCITRVLKAGTIVLAVYGVCAGAVLGIHELIAKADKNKVPEVAPKDPTKVDEPIVSAVREK